MLFKISLNNIKKSFKDYTIYFFTLILGVAIFYVFNAIESQTVLLDVSKSAYRMIQLMIQLLSAVSVVVSFILGFLIIYASRFLIKRRNKEFGIYLTLGMSKRKISLILFFETLLIGIISLAIGLGLGTILSQFMSLLVANMFEADMTQFKFVFSSVACVKTIIYFAIMYLIVIVFNTVNVSRCKLIDLLHSKKKSEKIKMKNPILCIIIFLISVGVLGYAYYEVTAGFAKLVGASEEKILEPIVLGCISTFFIFWSLSGLLIYIFKKMKKVYYKGLNSFTLRQFSSKINTTVFSTTIICLMLFIVICVLSSALSIKGAMADNLNELAPADVEFASRMNLDSTWLEEGYSEGQIQNSNLGVFETFNRFDINLKESLKEYIEFNVYNIPEFTFEKTLSDKLEQVKSEYAFLDYTSKEDIMKISDYNKVARLFEKEEFDLNENEYMIVADFDSMIKIRNEVLSENSPISIFGKTLTPKYQECKDGFIQLTGSHINTGIYLVPDDVVDNNYISYNFVVGNYKTNNKQDIIVFEEQINNLRDDEKANIYLLPEGTSRNDIAEASTGLGALVTFIGLYLGIIFLISSAAILALKELSESADNKERFMMLRKLGADDKMINKALFSQIGIFFLFPLLLATIHSIFGIEFATHVLETFGKEKMLSSVGLTAIFLIVIYGGYFVITYICSKNVIKEK